MKLFAESLLPDMPTPYLHLGYIASLAVPTTELPAAGPLIMSGMTIFALGLLLLLPLIRRPRWRWLPFSALIIGPLLALSAIYIKVPPYYEDPPGVTTMLVHDVYLGLLVRIGEGKGIPADIHETPMELGDGTYTDGWMRPLRITMRGVGTDIAYAVHSDGRDGLPGTADDITSH